MIFAKGQILRFLAVILALINSSLGLTLRTGEVTWVNRGQKTDFQISSALGNGVTAEAAWMGVGFNKVKGMNGASVVVCIKWNRGDSVQHYYNSAFSSKYLDTNNKQLGLENLVVSFANGRLSCSFTRDNTNPNPNYYNTTSDPNPYIIFAYGTPTADGNIQAHADREVTSSTVNLLVDSTTPATGVTSAATSAVTATSGATTTKQTALENGLFEGNGFRVTWKNSTSLPSATDFTVTIQALSSNIYAAIGFSDDKLMGGDDVCACIFAANKKTISRYYNPNGHQYPQLQPNTNGISNQAISISNGNLVCSFTRLNKLNEANYFDLNNRYHLLAVSGATDDEGVIQKHSSKVASDEPIDFLAYGIIQGKADDNAKSKAHGCLMVFAWMFCASIGIIIARYYKYIFPNRKIFGLQIWFVIHRPLMMFVPIVAIAAFIVILADLNWKWIDASEQLEFAHSIIGIVTIGFSIIQVFIAFFRCDKDHPKRFIFNYFHRSLGLFTFLLSVVTMFLGVFIDRMELGNVGWALLAGWAFWILAFPLILETLELIFASPKQSAGSGYMTNRSLLERIKSGAIILHLLIVLALTVALIVCIAIAKKGLFTPLI